MKTRYWIGILAAVILVCVAVYVPAMTATPAAQVEISSNGEVVLKLDLSEDGTYTISTADGGYNIITVENGKIAVTEASCPDHVCMERGFCSGGTPIVCLPNKLVITFLGKQAVDG